jgi:hypothetical protein
MGWSVGFDSNWNRDIGYGVPAFCDHPRCDKKIDRGLAYVCGAEPYGGDKGCGLYFCGQHQGVDQLCSRCRNRKPPFAAKPDHPEWTHHKLTDESWAEWRMEENYGQPLSSDAVDPHAGSTGKPTTRDKENSLPSPSPRPEAQEKGPTR